MEESARKRAIRGGGEEKNEREWTERIENDWKTRHAIVSRKALGIGCEKCSGRISGNSCKGQVLIKIVWNQGIHTNKQRETHSDSEREMKKKPKRIMKMTHFNELLSAWKIPIYPPARLLACLLPQPNGNAWHAKTHLLEFSAFSCSWQLCLAGQRMTVVRWPFIFPFNFLV